MPDPADLVERAEKAEAAIARVLALDPEAAARSSRDFGRGYAHALREVRAALDGADRA